MAALVVGLAGCGSDESTPPAPGTQELQRADEYKSKNGVLHLRVEATATTSTIAGTTYKRMYVYKTSLVDNQGEFKEGNASPYVGAQWSVNPGDTLKVDYLNELPDARFAPIGATETQLVPQPINLHTHGLTVSPSGNSDNVLLAIPQHRSNRFVIEIPQAQYHGLYWYHPHIHGVTDEQVYNGLAGHIVVGRADGNYRQFNNLTVHPMMIRYNVVAPGADKPPLGEPDDRDELIDASAFDTQGTGLTPDNGGPEGGKMIYTVNGQRMPRITIGAATAKQPAETQIWAMTNITGSASYILALEEIDAADAKYPRRTGRPLDFTIVSEDGTPMPRPLILKDDAAKGGYLLGQGGRVAILVQGASDPSKVVRLVQVENRSGTGDASAFDARPGKNRGIGGWRDYTREVLAIGVDAGQKTNRHVDTPTELTTNYTPHSAEFDHVAKSRTFHFNGVAPSTETEPNEFPVNDKLFLSNRVDQPKAGTVEQWTILNDSSLHHPFHVHTQYGKVMKVVAPINPEYEDAEEYPSLQYVSDLSQDQPADWTQDIVNLPPALVDTQHGMPIMKEGTTQDRAQAPGKVVLRLQFENYLGWYVEHCHRLPHEDRGMMSLVRTIPHDPVYAVSKGATVSVYRSSDNKPVRRFVPFGDDEQGLSTAVGDVDGDAIPDLAVASGRGTRSVVRVFSGVSKFKTQAMELSPFDDATNGGSVALGDLNADGRDDVIVGLNAGRARAAGDVAIFDGETGDRLADFHAYGRSFAGGVSVAAAMLEAGGRISLVTGAGAGKPTVKVFNFDLFGRGDTFPDSRKSLKPLEVLSFDGAESSNDGGVTVATANPYAKAGGFMNILVNPRNDGGEVGIFSLHQHHPANWKEVSVSGVSRPHDYQPGDVEGSRRMAVPQKPLRLGPDRNVAVGALSTTTGADLLTVPRTGGHVERWVNKNGALVSRGTLPATGTAVSGI